ncbi:MAG: OmpA family protein [Bacteroidota bacterium]
MKFTYTLLVAFLLASVGLQAQEGLPANPDPDKCYVRCIAPDVFETRDVRIMVKPAYTILEVTPGEFEPVTERVMVKEGYTRCEYTPATFSTERVAYDYTGSKTTVSVTPATFTDDTEDVLVQPAVNRWEYTPYEGCESDDPNDCQVLCYRSYDPVYRTVPVQRLGYDANSSSAERPATDTRYYTKEVVATPAQCREITVEPEFETITRMVETKAETVVSRQVPAEYITVPQQVLVTAGGLATYEEIDCELINYSVLPINYELGSARLTAESRSIIDGTLLNLMRESPNIRIQLNAHTDSRGSAASNQSLSERRAQSVVNYLVGKGINSSRLVSRGFGESQLKNRCADGVSCSEAEHAENRRTEFRVLNVDQ